MWGTARRTARCAGSPANASCWRSWLLGAQSAPLAEPARDTEAAPSPAALLVPSRGREAEYPKKSPTQNTFICKALVGNL